MITMHVPMIAVTLMKDVFIPLLIVMTTMLAQKTAVITKQDANTLMYNAMTTTLVLMITAMLWMVADMMTFHAMISMNVLTMIVTLNLDVLTLP